MNTPPYPDYTSGANGVTGALTRSFALFFGKDDMTFTVTSDYPGGRPKRRATYNRFSDMASDMVNVRIYHGLHFRFADEASREQGTTGGRLGIRTRRGCPMMKRTRSK